MIPDRSVVAELLGWFHSVYLVIRTRFSCFVEGFAECWVTVVEQLNGVLQGSVFQLNLADFCIQTVSLPLELLFILRSLMNSTQQWFKVPVCTRGTDLTAFSFYRLTMVCLKTSYLCDVVRLRSLFFSLGSRHWKHHHLKAFLHRVDLGQFLIQFSTETESIAKIKWSFVVKMFSERVLIQLIIDPPVDDMKHSWEQSFICLTV